MDGSVIYSKGHELIFRARAKYPLLEFDEYGTSLLVRDNHKGFLFHYQMLAPEQMLDTLETQILKQFGI